LELTRYVHLNPLRAKLVSDIKGLGSHPYSGHSVLMGRVTAEWQNTKYVLGLFGDKVSVARRRYLEFEIKGIAAGKRQDLTGGGLVRSVGGWSAVKSFMMISTVEDPRTPILSSCLPILKPGVPLSTINMPVPFGPATEGKSMPDECCNRLTQNRFYSMFLLITK